MTAPGAGTPAATAPGRAAFEAWEAALIDPPEARMTWDRLTGDEDAEAYRAAWEAAAQAAIAAQAWNLADQAIGLFLECRDVHGHDEFSARIAAAQEVAEGAAVTDAEISGSADGGGGRDET